MRKFFLALLVCFSAQPFLQGSDLLGLVLPTDNDAIFSSDPSKFYMYTDRSFEGVTSQPWQGGTYGFSRNPRRTDVGIVYTRMHEGVDIPPVHRSSSGEPLDEVRSIADGTVVYVNDSSSGSNYGRYIVIHHDWGNGPFFSLYAHLSETKTERGKPVKAGEQIAVMGYTGDGINRTRAHVHVEFAMILSDRFQGWYDHHFSSDNKHGIFNGFNLLGMDVSRLLIAHRQNPNISIPEFLTNTKEVYYKVLVPNHGKLDVLRRYPWLLRDIDRSQKPASWEFSFTDTGIPLQVQPSAKSVTYPTVSYVKPSGTDHSYLTSGRITGTGTSAKLTSAGSRFIQLISDSF
tara:strand:+ start:1907 stop:2941 length:1035 start_codon:yes stop_codon:yes gene_type:complete